MSISIFLHLQLAQPVFRFLGCSKKNTTVIISDSLQNSIVKLVPEFWQSFPILDILDILDIIFTLW